MPDVTRAVEEIAAIHAHLASREVYRGWRAIPVALSGLVGVLAALAAAGHEAPPDPWTFLRFWLEVSLVAFGVGCAEIAWRYLRSASPLERRGTLAVFRQLTPALLAGLVVPLALVRLSPALVGTAPGLWSLSLGLAVFAARPCLPTASVWVAGYYAGAGVLLLLLAPGGVPSPWTVGVTFGIGQGLAALLIQVTESAGRRPRDGHGHE